MLSMWANGISNTWSAKVCHRVSADGLVDADGPQREGDWVKAARLCPKVCGQDPKRWEDWIFLFAQKHQLQVRVVL